MGGLQWGARSLQGRQRNLELLFSLRGVEFDGVGRVTFWQLFEGLLMCAQQVGSSLFGFARRTWKSVLKWGTGQCHVAQAPRWAWQCSTGAESIIPIFWVLEAATLKLLPADWGDMMGIEVVTGMTGWTRVESGARGPLRTRKYLVINAHKLDWRNLEKSLNRQGAIVKKQRVVWEVLPGEEARRKVFPFL